MNQVPRIQCIYRIDKMLKILEEAIKDIKVLRGRKLNEGISGGDRKSDRKANGSGN